MLVKEILCLLSAVFVSSSARDRNSTSFLDGYLKLNATICLGNDGTGSGDDYGSSEEECAQLCSSLDICSGFSLSPFQICLLSQFGCALKINSVDNDYYQRIKPAIPKVDYYSGALGQYVKTENTECPINGGTGPNLNLGGGNPELYAQQCDENPVCVGFVFNEYTMIGTMAVAGCVVRPTEGVFPTVMYERFMKYQSRPLTAQMFLEARQESDVDGYDKYFGLFCSGEPSVSVGYFEADSSREEHCADVCDVTPGCTGFMFKYTHCYLLKSSCVVGKSRWAQNYYRRSTTPSSSIFAKSQILGTVQIVGLTAPVSTTTKKLNA